MGLRAWFNELRVERNRAREISACVEAAIGQIRVSDPAGVRNALAPIQAGDLSAEQQNDLLKIAIDHGDAKTFGTLLAITGDPNATIAEWLSGFRGPGYYTYTPFLNYALGVRSHDIALMLAKNPATTIEQRAYGYSSTPLEMAQKGGMSDVAAVLARRTADLRREEAARWDEMASKISTGPEA